MAVSGHSTDHLRTTLSPNFTTDDKIPVQSDAVRFSWIGCFAFVSVFGLIGNILVILIVWKNKRMRNPTNFLLINVAISDFIFVLTSTPSNIVMLLLLRKILTSKEYLQIFQQLLLSTNLVYVFFSTISTISLAVLAVERYNAMVHPMKIHRRLTKRGARIVICLSWFTATIFIAPLIVKFSKHRKMDVFHMIPLELKIYWSILAIIILAIPAGVIGFCYGRIMFGIYVVRNICNGGTTVQLQDITNRKKLTNMLLLVSLLFMIGHVPWICVNIYHTFQSAFKYNVALPAIMLHNLSPCLNPIIYIVYNTNYREGVKTLFRRNNLQHSGSL